MDEYHTIFQSAYDARESVINLEENTINTILENLARETELRLYHILSENEKDLQRMENGNPDYKRLKLTEESILKMVDDIRKVIALPSPTGHILYEHIHKNGLRIQKQTVPLGVIGILYECSSNTAFEAFSLCFKSKNVCILKGSSNARFTNEAFVDMIREVLDSNNINPNICNLLPKGRESTMQLLKATEYVDLVIPKGSRNLIELVKENSIIPFIETGAGVCHAYFNKYGDVNKGQRIITNAKTRNTNVCNVLDCLLIDKERLEDLPYLCRDLQGKEVIIYADKTALDALEDFYPEKLLQQAEEHDFQTEFLDYKMAVKTVSGIQEAITHINKHGARHSETIISEDKESIALFRNLTDAACIYENAPTSFTDGKEFGLGGETGISVQKMHARGPVALEELCTYKWIIEGEGQIREN